MSTRKTPCSSCRAAGKACDRCEQIQFNAKCRRLGRLIETNREQLGDDSPPRCRSCLEGQVWIEDADGRFPICPFCIRYGDSPYDDETAPLFRIRQIEQFEARFENLIQATRNAAADLVRSIEARPNDPDAKSLYFVSWLTQWLLDFRHQVEDADPFVEWLMMFMAKREQRSQVGRRRVAVRKEVAHV